MRPLITLTTDFGERDPYAAAMKGVILAIAPESRIVDLTHEIAPQDIHEAALFLRATLPWFPKGSIHIVVVDPGVGTTREPLAVDLDGRIVVCPNNGLLGWVMELLPMRRAIILDPAKCSDKPVSATFHGRDLFAPAAARIAAGTPMEQLGDTIETVEKLPFPSPKWLDNGWIEGEVIHIDRFGNCITNIPGDWAAKAERPETRIDGMPPAPFHRTYGEVAVGAPLAYAGSSGLLEVALNQGNASRAHGIERGARVSVIMDLNGGRRSEEARK